MGRPWAYFGAWIASVIFGGAAALVRAQDAEPTTPPPRISITSNSSLIRSHRSGTWTALSVTAVNSTDEGGEGLIAVYFPDDAGRQYARRIWVPPHARRHSFLPIQIPPNLPNQVDRLSLMSIALDPNSTREVYQRRPGELFTSDQLLGISQDAIKSATYLNKPSAADPTGSAPLPDRDAWETLMAARVMIGLSESSNDLNGDFLPSWSDVLQGFDQILLSSDRILADAAGLASLRSWVRDGGRLWITADRVSNDTLQALLGNAMPLEVVDRVELDQFVVESQDTSGRYSIRDESDFEEPVEFVRLVTSSQDVTCRIDGWPAAFWIPMGEGEVLVTTLGARGWRDPGTKKPIAGLRPLASRLFAGREGRVDAAEFRPLLEQQIGYRIPSRGLAFGLLGSYCAALLIGGVVLAQRGRLEQLVWWVPVVTLLTAGVLVGVGAASSRRVPPTIAHGQLLRFSPETNEVQTQALAAVYDQQSRPMVWRGEGDAWAIPDRPSDSVVRRQVFRDDGTTESQNTSTLAGSIGQVTLAGSQTRADRVAAVGRFGPEGLEGRLSATGLDDVSDLVIVSLPSPALGLTLARDGTFVARPEQVLASDQFSSDTLLSDEQRRRQELLRRLLDPADPLTFPHNASLLFWCRPLPTGVIFPDDYERAETGLAVVPMELQRTPSGGRFRVPATFLRMTTIAGRMGQSLAFNPKSNQWVKGLTTASESVLRFQLPEQVVPCRLDSGTLSVRINAPSRDLEVWSYGAGEPTLIRRVPDPNGVLQFELNAEQLHLDDQSGVRVGLQVTPTRKQQSERANAPPPGTLPPTSIPNPQSTFDNSTWQIEYVRLTVNGQTLQASNR